MADVIVGGTVVLLDVEWIYSGSNRSPGEKDVWVSAIGHVVKGVAVGVVRLHTTFAPAAVDVVFEGERHALIVRYATGVQQAYGAEPRIEGGCRKPGERRNTGASGPSEARTAKSVYT